MTKNKEWPTNPHVAVGFSSIIEPVIEAIRKTHNVERIEGTGHEWSGLPLGKRDRSTCVDPSEKLSKEQLVYSEIDKGQSALSTIITIAIQLGIEQGRRLERRGS